MKLRKLLLLIALAPVSIFAQMADRYDVVIDEIFADPSPRIGLTEAEFIELRNTTTTPFNLSGWRIGDLAGVSGPLPHFILQPDSFVIVCSSNAEAALSAFGTAIPVAGFPSLDNNGDQVFLRSLQNKIIHAVAYSSSWYQNELKKDGGWTLEMIDTKSPCGGISNWKSSINSNGGTPGKINSIDGNNSDQIPPKLKRTYTIDSVTIIAVFDEPLDSLKGAAIANYSISNGPSVIAAITLGPLFNEVQLRLDKKMLPQNVYQLTANNVTDCKGNIIGTQKHAKTGIPEDAGVFDKVINEILFNPRGNAYDYVEFYNRSHKIFDAAKLYVANRNGSGVVSSIRQLSATPYYVFPGEYIVITEYAASLQLNYLVSNPDAVLVISSFPSFPDDEGNVILLNLQGEPVDEVRYKHEWHFKLIGDAVGVSLERIDPDGPSQDATNWHSAASTAGYGTPTYQNSQYKQTQSITAAIEISPKIFSPDNDGRDDIATIQYQVIEPGYVANISIFDAAGRAVRYLVKNGTLGLKGYWNWDGLNEKGNKLPVGTYIIFTEIFNLQGKKERFKNVIILARMLN